MNNSSSREANNTGASVPIYDIFQPGLVRGSASLRHAQHKLYAYVEHPTEGWRVYLRSCSFLHDENDPNPLKFVVVKATHKKPEDYTWEPPKGQMEGKDLPRKGQPILEALMHNANREINEETGIPGDIPLEHTGLVFQGRENDYPPKHYFQYHMFYSAIPYNMFEYAKNRFTYYKAHPREFKALTKDYQEKDDIEWFDMKKTRLFGRWSPSIVMLYVNSHLAKPKMII
jgi:8-oxo-dGTP pyrophosphatase MutT (NUDIX family)